MNGPKGGKVCARKGLTFPVHPQEVELLGALKRGEKRFTTMGDGYCRLFQALLPSSEVFQKTNGGQLICS